MFIGYQNSQRYFAAANSYFGFVSFFKEIFQPEGFTKTVILKGGPGTGKSSFMKDAAKKFCKQGYKTDLILCSSDSESLDGVIARRGSTSFAILDGTAPHICDPIYPGSHDCIFNFAPFWNERILSHARIEIESLVKKKKNAYALGYRKLALCKELDAYIAAEYQHSLKENKLKKFMSEVNVVHGKKHPFPKIRLLRAFGKNGYEEIVEENLENQSRICLSGDRRAVRALLSSITSSPQGKEVDECILCPSVPSEYDQIKLGEKYIGFDSSSNQTTDSLFGINLSESSEAKAIAAFEAEAKEEFAFAAVCHEKLEQIYRNAMNFNLLNEAREECIASLLSQGENRDSSE